MASIYLNIFKIIIFLDLIPEFIIIKRNIFDGKEKKPQIQGTQILSNEA